MAFSQIVSGLEVVDPADAATTWSFRVKQEDEGRAIRIANIPWEPARMPVQEWSKDLLPFIAGASRTKDLNPNGLSLQPQVPADTFLPEMVAPGPLRNALTLTNATQQVTKWVEARDNAGTAMFGICGRYLIRVSSTYAVTSQDLGAGRVATDIVRINGDLIICCGGANSVQRRNVAGSLSAGNFVAFAMAVVRNLIWRVGPTGTATTSTVTNTLSSFAGLNDTNASAVIVNANWSATSPPYIVGDGSYQCVQLYDNGGTLAGGRADGLFMPDPSTKFLNITPQIARSPDPSGLTGYGCWSAFGKFFVPYQRGLLRLEPGFAEDVGPGTAYIPKLGLRVMGGFEWDRLMYVLLVDQRTNDGYVMKMIPDRQDIADGEFIFQPYAYIAGNATHYAKAIGIFSGPTQPTIVFGGGQVATDASYIMLGRGAGRDLGDSGYRFVNGDSYVTTGIFAPSENLSMVSTITKSQVYVTGASASTPVVIQYSASTSLMPGDNSFTDMTDNAAIGTAAITTVGNSIRYPARDAQGRFFNMRLKLTSVGTAAIEPACLRWTVHGYSNPKTAQQITVRVVLEDERSKHFNRGTLANQSDVYQKLCDWVEAGTTLQFKLEGYDDAMTTATDIISCQLRGAELVATTVNVDASAGSVMTPVCELTLVRVDYSDNG